MIKHLNISAALALMLLISGGTVSTRAADDVDAAATNYLSADGFETQSIENVEGALSDLIKADPNAMIPQDVDISPIEKAFLMLDTQEEPLPMTRYVMRYNQKTIDNVEVSFIDVQRYNLGPVVRRKAVEDYGAENTADEYIFGIGPNVEWRFVTQPTAKQAALLLGASRREISTEEAAKADCLPRSCLSLDTIDGLAQWSDAISPEKPMTAVAYPAITSPDSGNEVAPAYLALRLALEAGLATDTGDGVSWSLPKRQGGDTDEPFILVIVDRNLGQEIISDALLGLAKMGLSNDQSWTRLISGYFDKPIVERFFTAKDQFRHDGSAP